MVNDAAELPEHPTLDTKGRKTRAMVRVPPLVWIDTGTPKEARFLLGRRPRRYAALSA